MISIVCGVPRSGKTTYAVSLAVRECRKRVVYTNFGVYPRRAFPSVIGSVYKVEGSDFYKYYYPEGSLLILDEAALDFDARNWSSFPKEAVEFIKLHGHQRIDIVFVTQAYTDIDKKIRGCAERLFYVVKGAFGFSRLYEYKFVRPQSENTTLLKGGVLSEEEFGIKIKEPSILGGFFSRKIWRPAFYRAFDSYSLRGDKPLLRAARW